MRDQFECELHELNQSLLEMAMLIEHAIHKAISLLDKKDERIAREVHECEQKLDEYEAKVQKDCLRIFVSQQPTATDLRQVSAALKMITDMERIGDNSRDIAEICMSLPAHYDTRKFPLIKDMAQAASQLVHEAIESFIDMDEDRARVIDTKDDVVDSYFDEIRRDLVSVIKRDFDSEAAIDFIMIAKYIERIADHAVNMSQWVVFIAEG